MPLPTPYQNFIHISKYGRWVEEKRRRETWDETVYRYVKFWKGRYQNIDGRVWSDIYDYISGLQVMPSMRAMMTAGTALERENTAGYNCAYVAIDNWSVLPEIMYCLMCGCGVGFSVERQFIGDLPKVPEKLTHDKDYKIVVDDSRDGWCNALSLLLYNLYTGTIPSWDLSQLRPRGARLKTFGGRSSGPEVLDDMFKFIVSIFIQSQGDRLTSLQLHDIVCRIGTTVVSGGVRRSALISLSNLSDDRMRSAKSGDWRSLYPWREVANNSAVYADYPSMDVFFKEWMSLMESKSGERGIYNLKAARKQAEKTGRDPDVHYGTNPCSEIILRSKQFCNLSEVVIREYDTLDILKDKVRIATIIGTLQSTLTDFKFLSDEWKQNCESERLLGVSLTGIFDNEITSGRGGSTLKYNHSGHIYEARSQEDDMETLRYWLRELKSTAVETNRVWAKKLGIKQSASITCVKPSGTVSQLVNSSNGIHPRYSRFYIRRVRLNDMDPIAKLLIDKRMPFERSKTDKSDVVFSFPMKSPESAVLRSDITALEQLELGLVYQEEWCHHKPSQTIYVRDWEWMEVGAWIYRHFNRMTGVSFLPYNEDNTLYSQMPYEEIDEYQYNSMLRDIPEIDWLDITKFEFEDNTESNIEPACTAASCDI
jgi:ribonucleoside-diphosphate reductase alpha chain